VLSELVNFCPRDSSGLILVPSKNEVFCLGMTRSQTEINHVSMTDVGAKFMAKGSLTYAVISHDFHTVTDCRGRFRFAMETRRR